MNHLLLIPIIVVSILSSLPGCASGGARVHGPYSPQTESARNPIRAQELTQQAAALISQVCCHLGVCAAVVRWTGK